MARIKDRWYKTEKQPDGSTKRVKSAEFEVGRRWQVQWTDDRGKGCKKNFTIRKGTNPEIHAEAFKTQIEADLLKGTYVSPEDANIAFKDFATEWLKNHKTGDLNTDARRERQLRLHVFPAIGDRTLRELAKRPSIVQAWIQGLKGSTNSKNTIVKDVSPIFQAAVDDELITRNPLSVKSVKRPPTRPTKAEAWPLEWVEGMSAAMPERWAIVPYLGAGTGMRQGEIFGLAVEDIDFLRRKITVNTQLKESGKVWTFAPLKNQKPHEVPLAESLAVRLSEHIRRYPPVEVTLPWGEPGGTATTRNLLITNSRGKQVHSRNFSEQVWRPARRSLGIRDSRENGMHGLRHTYASIQLSSGVDLVTVANYLGDTVATVAKTYAHFVPGGDDRSRAAVESFFEIKTAEDLATDLETKING